MCSYLSFAIIKILDLLPGDQMWKEEIIQSIALMTGFAWRRCYGLTIDLFTVGLVIEFDKYDWALATRSRVLAVLSLYGARCIHFSAVHTKSCEPAASAQ